MFYIFYYCIYIFFSQFHKFIIKSSDSGFHPKQYRDFGPFSQELNGFISKPDVTFSVL